MRLISNLNIIVCLKQVPATTEVRVDPKTNTLIREGVKSMVNPLDTHALEEAVRLRERYGGRVIAITMGPPQAEEMLRDAISCGADEAILLSDRAFAGSDTLATSYVLSKAIARIESCDLVICGKQTLDGDTGQVGPQLAQMLGLLCVAYVSRIEEVEKGWMRLERVVDEGREVVEAVLPAVLTVVKEINTPRLPSLRGMAKAKSIEIPVWTAKDLDISPDRVGLAGSPTCVVKVFTPQRTRRAEILTGSLEHQVEQLVQRLREIVYRR